MIGRDDHCGFGMVGCGFMGRAHWHALRNVGPVFNGSLQSEMIALCGRDGTAAAEAATRLGWSSRETDWRALISRPDIGAAMVGAPGHLHAEISIGALEEGKHVLCEKPLANSVSEAQEMANAAAIASQLGIRSMLGHNYRRVPAIALTRRIVAQGRTGAIQEVRALYLQDWLVDPTAYQSWRLSSEAAGSGALGDLESHVVDLVHHLVGSNPVTVSAIDRTYGIERTKPNTSDLVPVTPKSRGKHHSPNPQ